MGDRSRSYPAVVELTRARLLESIREPEALFWMFVFPVLMALALGIAFPARTVDPVIVGLVAGERAAATAEALSRVPGVEVQVLSREAADLALSRATVQIVVEPGAPPAYRYDPARAEGRLARRVFDHALQRAAGREDAWAAREVTATTVGARYIDWLIPGLLGMTVMSTGLWGVGFSVVQARTRKLLKRLVATPMRRRDYLLAQGLSRLVFLVLEAAVLLAFGAWVFGVPMYGSWVVLGLVTLLGASTFVAIGLLAASRARTVEALSGLLNLITLPMWILSGVFFSSSNFPLWLQPFIQALPLTALNDALRLVMLEGGSWAVIAGDVGLLSAWALGSFGLALFLFRWR
jgi:ABC-2 type transport system permease protein